MPNSFVSRQRQYRRTCSFSKFENGTKYTKSEDETDFFDKAALFGETDSCEETDSDEEMDLFDEPGRFNKTYSRDKCAILMDSLYNAASTKYKNGYPLHHNTILAVIQEALPYSVAP